jgi:hypothetical protein
MEIQFAEIITDPKTGEDVKDEAGNPVSLCKACTDALDAPLKTDADEGLKPKLKRGRLIEEIEKAAKDVALLALDTGDIELIKSRLGGYYMRASFVRKVCRMLDPASKE